MDPHYRKSQIGVCGRGRCRRKGLERGGGGGGGEESMYMKADG